MMKHTLKERLQLRMLKHTTLPKSSLTETSMSSWIVDFNAERLLRLLLRVVHIDQYLHRASTLAGGESEPDSVTLSTADLNTVNTTNITSYLPERFSE